MITLLLTMPLVVPLAMAAMALAVRHHRTSQRVAALLGASTLVVAGTGLLVHTLDHGPVAVHVGGFAAPVAINLAADVLSGLMLTAAGLLLVVCLVFAMVTRADRSDAFHVAGQALAAGLALSFLTADLFNLFVAFEVLLVSSYVLVALHGSVGRDAAFRYAAVNLVGSTVLLAGVGLVYAGAGTVNLAALHEAALSGATLAGSGLVLVAFVVKAGLVPVHGWLPTTYPRAHPATAAMFSGLLTKVGAYALYRVVTLVLPGEGRVATGLAILAGVSMLVGVLGAIGQDSLRGILSFHITSQVGYIVMGLAIGGPVGLAAGIAYTVHHMFAKTALFLTAGAVETVRGTGSLDRLGGLARSWGTLAATFGVAAMALAGLPPFSGFVPKLGLLVAAFTTGPWALGAVSVVVTVLTLASMVKIWVGAYWSTGPDRAERGTADTTVHAVPAGAAGAAEGVVRAPEAVVDRGRRRALVAPAVACAAAGVLLGIGLGAGGLMEVAGVAADQLLAPDGYVRAVLGERGS